MKIHNNYLCRNVLCRSVLCNSVRKAMGITSMAVAAIAVTAPVSVQVKAQSVSKMEEVTVTARRRDESLSRVPIAVSAISSDQLADRQVLSDSDLQFAVPGLTVRQTQGNNSLTYSIRGQSADTFSGSPSAVVAYMNEVPLTISGASTFFDLESVQVLKGPQGTLFGRNTTGGAVLYTAAKPTEDTEGKLTLRAGNFGLQELEGMYNTPLIADKVLLRVAFNTIDRDGYIDNVTNGIEHGEIGRDSARVSLTVRPSDTIENTTMYSYSRTDGTNTGATYVYSIYEAGQTNNGFALNTSSSFIASAVDEQRELGYYKTQHPYGADHVGEDEVLTNTTTIHLSDTLRLKNIFGYTTGDTDSEQPALGALFPTFATRNIATGKVGNETEIESYSNEVQLSGEALDGRLSYIAGIYLQQQRTDTLWPQTYFAGAVTATSNFGIETDTTAVYTQGTYSLTDDLRVTAGYRYTKEDVSIEQLSEADALGAPDQNESFSEPSWELGLEYDINNELFAYAKTRSSFRSGGFNGSAPPVNATATGGGNKFNVETVQDFELGLKFRGLLMDRPATVNLAVYHQQVEDVQRIEFPDPPGPVASIAVTANIPEMEVDGMELEASIMPTDWWEVGVVAAYTDAAFTDGETNLFGQDYSYSPVANTPETTWTLWTSVNFMIDPSMGELSLRAQVYGQDEMYFSNTYDSIGPETKLPDYELVNARLSWKNMMGSEFSGALFAKNLTDEAYFAGGMALGASLGHNAAAVGEPRTLGVELTYDF